MATYTVASLLSRAAIILQDTTNVRWPLAELLGWLNDGQREVARVKPNSNVKTVPVQLVAGAKQQLPVDGVALVDLARNLGSDGNTPGRSIRKVDRRILDAQVPYWSAMTPTSEVVHYCYTNTDPKIFYVYPPQPATGSYAEMQYLSAPIDITDQTSTITLDDIYAAPILDYILYRAYQKDADYSQNEGLSQVHWQAFNSALAGKLQAEAMSGVADKQGAK
jgi:hypothetical protein